MDKTLSESTINILSSVRRIHNKKGNPILIYRSQKILPFKNVLGKVLDF